MIRFINEKRNICAEAIGGSVYQGFIGISKSYQEAKEEKDDALMRKSLSVNSSAESSIKYYYPTDWEIQLIHQLKIGNREMPLKIIDKIQKENLSRDLPQNMNIKVTMLVFDTLIRVADELNLETSKLHEIYESSVIEENAQNQWEALKEIVLIMTKVKLTQTDSGDTNYSDIIQYVKDNYSNYDLSLKSLSERFNMSVSSISRVFKTTAGINFSDYLCRMRMEKAKLYIEENEYSMERIASMVGYDSYMSFRRAFIRNEGFTPSEYREKVKK